MKTKAIVSAKSFLALCLLVLITGCGGGGSGTGGSGSDTSTTTTNSTNSTNSTQATGSITVALNWSANAKSVDATPAGVTRVRVSVTAADITATVQQDFNISAIVNNSVTITGVPAGTNRTVTVKGLDASGSETHQGNSSAVTVTAGAAAQAVSVTMNTKGVSMNMAQSNSDTAQITTMAFSAFAMVTGNLGAQSFFPPGKIADYTGFQYLRDNDPDNI